MPPWLPGMNVGNVYFDKRNIDTQQGIADNDTGVGEAAGVDDDNGHFIGVNVSLLRKGASPSCSLDTIDDGTFVVGLEGLELKAEVLRLYFRLGLDVGQCRGAIDVRLPKAQKVEVWTVDEKDASCGHVGGEKRTEEDDDDERVICQVG